MVEYRRLFQIAVLVFSLTQAASSAYAAPAPAMQYRPAHPSNYTTRSSRRINMIVIHTTEGSESGAISWLQNRRSNVSAHYVVGLQGRITRMVSDKDAAWHVRGYNSNSIGIENVGYAHRNTWTNAQYNSLISLLRWLCDTYGVPKSRSAIRGHNELDPSRRSDPGPYFDWNRVIRGIQGSSPRPTASAPPAPSGRGTPSTRTTPPRTSTASARAIEVTTASLRVRSRAWGSILGSVNRGNRFVLTGRSSSGWYEIYWAGRKAWIHGSYLRTRSGSGVQVTAGGLNVRTGPSTSYWRLGAVLHNQRYVTDNRHGAWNRIWFDRRQAWAHGAWLRPVPLSR